MTTRKTLTFFSFLVKFNFYVIAEMMLPRPPPICTLATAFFFHVPFSIYSSSSS